ncbi:PKD domain-containing protein [Methanofollis liminatans]|nr:PKD domain-containing protein [Methanofollis liminatans]
MVNIFTVLILCTYIIAGVQAAESYEFVTKWGSYGSGDAQFIRPEGIAVDPGGDVYVADPGNNRIQKFSNTGDFITKWGAPGTGAGQFSYPRGVAVDGEGYVYVVEQTNNRVQKFDGDGTYIATWGTKGSGEGQFESPGGIAVDNASNIYVTDTVNHRVQKFDSTGTFVTQWGNQGAGDGQFRFPMAIAIGKNDSVYVGDENYRIQKFDANGTFITKWGSEGMGNGQFTYPPSGAAVDDQGNLFVAEGQYYTGSGLLYRVQKFDSNGTFITKWGYRGSGDGEFQYPKGVAVDSGGYVYVADGEAQRDYHRIQKFSSLPFANFTGEPTEGDFPLRVNFTDISRGSPTSWSWDFGDGNFSEEQHPFSIYTVPGVYNVSLTVENEISSNTTTKNGYITVLDWVKANFTMNTTEGAAPLTVQFTDTSTGGLAPPDTWEWSLARYDDPEWSYTTDEQNLNYTFMIPDWYIVSLWVGRDNLSDIYVYSGQIIVTQPPPVTNFIGYPTVGSAPLTVRFNDTSAGNATQWFWDFGDGNTSTLQHPTKTYEIPGLYTISLNATNDGGSNSSTKESYINVTNFPVIPVSDFIGTPTSGRKPLAVQFTDLSTGGPTEWFWEFGDGTTSTERTPQKTYTTVGTYTVSLNATNVDGSSTKIQESYISVTDTPTPPVANFTGTPANGTAPLTVQFNDTSTGVPTEWFWEFGDGTNSTSQNPQKTYTTLGTYTVSLSATNADGSSTKTRENYITVTDDPVSPVANFTGTPTTGRAPLTVQYTDLSTGEPTEWFWQFGDGTNSIEQNPLKTYTTLGTYTVSLNATNADGSSTKTRENYITVTDDPVPPVANFTGTPTNGTAPLTVQFTDLSTGGPAQWLWDFGDGTNSTDQNPQKTYTTAGTYTVSLNATNADGSSTKTRENYITVTDEPASPGANFSGTPKIGIAPLTVQFTDLSTREPTQWFWEFGDGTNSTDQNPKKTYTTIGTYTVSLNATNAQGSSTVTKVNYINATDVPTPANFRFISEWGSRGTADGEFTYPDGIVRDTAGNIYVVDYGNDRIQKFNRTGSFITKWGSSGYSEDGEFNMPHGIAVDSDSNVYVTDTWNSRIQKFDSTGTFIAKWGSYGTGDGQFDFPQGITIDADGSIYVADNANQRIQKFDSNGTFITKWGSGGTGDGEFDRPHGIVVDADGNVFVSDAGNNNIQKFTSTGTFITKWGTAGSGDGQFNVPRGIAVDSRGNVFVADSLNHRIQIFDTNGTFLTEFGSYGTGEGEFNEPWDTLVDNAGNVYVTDARNHRIQIFEPIPEGMPFTSFTALPTAGTAPLTVTFTDESTGEPTEWQWTFGDGTISHEQNPKKTYMIPGFYTVSLTATNAVGSDTNTKNDYITVSPLAEDYEFVMKWGSYGDGRLLGPMGIGVDAAGNVCVADSNNLRIQKFDRNGTFSTKWGSPGSGDGEFGCDYDSYSENGPHGVVMDAAGNVYVADLYNNRIQKFDANGTFITKWGSYGSGDGEFSDPRGITVDSAGYLYVSDYWNNRIQKFDSSGTFITKFVFSQGSGDGQFGLGPDSVAVDRAGNLYVTDPINSRIQKFDNSGTFIAAWGSYGAGIGQFRSPTGIAVDADSNVYVADSLNNRIQKFSSTGTFLTSWGLRGTGDGEFEEPRGIVVDAESHVYVTDHYNNRIQKFDSSGTFITTWGSEPPGDSEFSYPKGVAVDDAGNVYVADTNNHRIQKFDANGTFITTWGHEESPSLPGELPVIEANGNFSFPKGVAIDGEGFVYVADSGNNRIQKFDANGTFITKWGGWPVGYGDGQFSGLRGIAVDEDGFIYVADAEEYVIARIQKFDSNGTFITKWGSYGTGAGEFMDPQGVATDPFGNVYVTDGYGGRIQKFDISGTFIATWVSDDKGVGQLLSPSCIATDDAGNVYVTSFDLYTASSDIRKFTGNGIFITTWGVSGSGDGEFSGLLGVAVNGDGLVYAADEYNNRIQVFRSYTPATPPVAAFIANVTSGSAPLAVQFTDTSTGNPASWVWNFGDGNTSTVQNPSHIYTMEGTFNVSLNVSNAGGSDTITKVHLITISAPVPEARFDLNRNFAASTENDTFVPGAYPSFQTYRLHAENLDEKVYLGNLTYVAGVANITSVEYDDYATWNSTYAEWNFPSEYVIGPQSAFDTRADTSFAEFRSFTHTLTRNCSQVTFTAPGIQETNITLVLDDLDFESVFVGFASAKDHNMTTEIINSSFMTNAPLSTPLLTDGSYHLKLDKSALVIGTEYYFRFDTTIIPNGTAVMHKPIAYVWEGQNNGSADLGVTNKAEIPASMLPADASEFSVQTNTSCNWGVVWQDNLLSILKGMSIRVTLPAAANFTAEPLQGYTPLTVQFTDTSTGNVTSWFWNFGDGANSTEQNPVHVYTAPGSYSVALSINGGEDTFTDPGYIRVTSGVLLGDANNDGEVNQADTLRVLKEVVGLLDPPEKNTDDFERTDVHWNGAVEVGDAMFIAQYNVGLRDAWFRVIE